MSMVDYQPRVLPNVFQDIPSTRELERAKSARASLTIWVILLLGMLIATAAALVYVVTVGSPLTPAGQLQDRIDQLERDVGALNTELAAYRGQNTTISPLVTAMAEGEAQRARLRRLVAEERPWAANLIANIDQSRWTVNERRQALNELRGDIDDLLLVETRVRNARQPQNVGTTPNVDNSVGTRREIE